MVEKQHNMKRWFEGMWETGNSWTDFSCLNIQQRSFQTVFSQSLRASLVETWPKMKSINNNKAKRLYCQLAWQLSRRGPKTTPLHHASINLIHFSFCKTSSVSFLSLFSGFDDSNSFFSLWHLICSWLQQRLSITPASFSSFPFHHLAFRSISLLCFVLARENEIFFRVNGLEITSEIALV